MPKTTTIRMAGYEIRPGFAESSNGAPAPLIQLRMSARRRIPASDDPNKTQWLTMTLEEARTLAADLEACVSSCLEGSEPLH